MKGSQFMTMHVVLGTATFALLALTYAEQFRPSFGYVEVRQMAESLSENPYQDTQKEIPAALHKINYDQLRDIRWRDGHTIWREQGLPFQLKAFHLGDLQLSRIQLATVDGMSVDPVEYSPALFEFGENEWGGKPIPELPADLGFGGFRVHYPLNQPDYLDELIVFQGASYFRALAANTVYGLSARGVAVNTAVEGKKEEFPSFTRFWVKQPSPGATQLTVHALLEGKSLTGAYEFVITPGDPTHIHVKAELFIREDIQQLGLAPLTSMYWFGENQPYGNDYRPEVHDSDGLLLKYGEEDWTWQPLAQEKQPAVHRYPGRQARGFGLLQRDRDFAHYEDMEAKYHQRPSLWIEPRGDWGEGEVVLMVLPTGDEYHDNVVAFWSPKRQFKSGDRLAFEYTMTWCGEYIGNELGRTVATRVQRHIPARDGQPEQALRFLVDMAGGRLDGFDDPAQLKVQVTSDPPDAVAGAHIMPNAENQTWRVVLTIKPEFNRQPLKLSSRLANQKGAPQSETWTYQWKP